MSMQLNWYAVYTRPKWEKKVADNFKQRGIIHYCPLNKVMRQWHDRKKIIQMPLFPSYVFIKCDENTHRLIKMVDGVLNLVYWQGKPAVIREVEIDTIKKFLNDYTDVHLEKTPVGVNDIIKVTHGPLMEREGQVLAVKNKTVKVSLPSLGYIMVAEIELAHIQVIQKPVPRLIN